MSDEALLTGLVITLFMVMLAIIWSCETPRATKLFKCEKELEFCTNDLIECETKLYNEDD